MSFCDPLGFLDYNPKDLIPDGFIWPILSKERSPDTSLRTDLKGVSFLVERDEGGNVTKVVEKRKQLPASMLSLEIVFGTKVSTSGGSLFAPGDFLGTPLATTIGGPLTSGMIMPGIGSSSSQFILQICDAETKINMPISITKEIIDTGIIELPFYLLSIFAVVKEHMEIDEYGKEEIVKGIQFTNEELQHLGSVEGNPYYRIRGSTDPNGQFGGRIQTIVIPPPTLGSEEANNSEVPKEKQNLFLGIVKDEYYRLLRFRSEDLTRPIMVDATSKKIKINTSTLTSQDIGKNLYATMSVAFDRKTRQIINQKATLVSSGTSIGIAGVKYYTVGIKVSSLIYKICKWLSPKSILDISVDSNFKIKINEFPDLNEETSLESKIVSNENIEVIEGWRKSEDISFSIEKMWAADRRGILLVDFSSGGIESPKIEVIFPYNNILDKTSFDIYLEQNDLLDNDIVFEDIDISGSLYDVSEINNTFLFDSEKISYYRKFALFLQNENTSNVGIINLDLFYNNINIDKNKFDLKDVVFKDTEMTSPTPTDTTKGFTGGYNSNSCYSFKESQMFFDPGNPTLDLFVPSNFYVDISWRLQTPFFLDKFNTKTRIYVENFSGSLSEFSMVFVRTAPIIEGSISLDFNYSRKAFLFFEDPKFIDAISFHSFKSSSYNLLRGKLKYNTNGVNEREPYSYDFYKNIGYSRLIGTEPSYSNGKPISFERLYACNPELSGVTWEDIYTEYNFDVNILSNGVYSIDIPNILLKSFSFNYGIKKEFQNDFINAKLMSLYFSGSDTSIDNFYIDDGNNIVLDTGFYKDGPIEINTDKIEGVDIRSIKGMGVQQGVLSKYVAKGKQFSVSIDPLNNRIAVFYQDNKDNISVVISYDDTRSWINYQGIIRLAKGEKASSPFTVKNGFGSTVHLFYVLNNSFLMYRSVNLEDFLCEDSFLEYDPPDLIGVGFKDDDIFAVSGDYSKRGKNLRKETSYFVDGNSSDLFFVQEINITRERIRNNNEGMESIRFNFIGNEIHMDLSFEDARYSVYKDNQGSLKLFIIKNNKLFIKLGSAFITWFYVAKDIRIHRSFFQEGDLSGNLEIENPEIRNISTVYNSSSDDVTIFYFHNEMMFMRRFINSELQVNYSSQGNLINTNLLKVFDVEKGNLSSMPIFVVGKLSNVIYLEAIKIIKFLDEAEKDGDLFQAQQSYGSISNLAIRIPYSEADIKTFDGRLDVDSEVQPFGYVTEFGDMRLFYSDSNGFIEGISINANSIPTLDVKLKNKN